MIEGLVALMESVVDVPVNIENPDERTINELAEVIIDLIRSDSGITYEKSPPQHLEVRRPDISKAKEEVGWEPTVDLQNGLG